MGQDPDDPLGDYPDTPLKLAMLQRRVSIRGLARRLAPDADEKRLANLRGQIRGWLGGAQPQDDNAGRLAAALGLPDSYFVKASRSNLREEVSTVRAELTELRRRLDEIEATIRERLDGPQQDRPASSRW